MNQRRITGETTLDALQRSYLQTQLRAKALRICDELDRGCDYASGQAKLRAMALVQTLIKRL